MSQAAQRYHVSDTAMGFCDIAWSDAGVVRFQIVGERAEVADRLMRRRADGAQPGAPPQDVAAVVATAKRYFAVPVMGWTAPRTASACQDGRCHQPI